MNVLVTSVARKVPMLGAVRTALRDVAPQAALHGADLDPDAIGRFFVDAFWAMPAVDDLALDDVLTYCDRHAIGLIVPTRDGELGYWARHRSALERAGVAVLVSDSAAVDTCLDKLRCAETLLAAGEPAIPTATAPGPFAADRYVVKERFGAGARSIGLDLSRALAKAHAARLRDPVFQPFVPGTEYSVDLFAGMDGEPRGIVARRRELVVDGESQITATVRDAALELRGARIARLLGLRGHAVIQVLVDGDGAHHVVECNPRFGGASTLASAAGLDTFAWAYLEARGEALDARPFRRRVGELRQVRAAHDHLFPAEPAA